MISSSRADTHKVNSPFNYEAKLLKKIHVSRINDMYKEKCNVDVLEFLDGLEYLDLYECSKTGYKFWMPVEAAGNEKFYHLLSIAWENYYRESRWEYGPALKHINNSKTILEIGCGRGYFLQLAELKGAKASGLEFNSQAIDNKVCNSPVYNEIIEEHAEKGNRYDVVLSFQVLEHVSKPREFLTSAISCLKDNGYLILSTPNDDWIYHQRMEDAFNLPPHHIGCFNKKVYENIAKEIGMEIVEIKSQNCLFHIERYNEATERNFFFKLYKKISQIIGNQILKLTKEPGHTILCVMKKSQ